MNELLAKIVTRTVTVDDFYKVTRKYDHLFDLLQANIEILHQFNFELGDKGAAFQIFSGTYLAGTTRKYVEVSTDYLGNIKEMYIYE